MQAVYIIDYAIRRAFSEYNLHLKMSSTRAAFVTGKMIPPKMLKVKIRGNIGADLISTHVYFLNLLEVLEKKIQMFNLYCFCKLENSQDYIPSGFVILFEWNNETGNLNMDFIQRGWKHHSKYLRDADVQKLIHFVKNILSENTKRIENRKTENCTIARSKSLNDAAAEYFPRRKLKYTIPLFP